MVCADFQASSSVELQCNRTWGLGTCYNRARKKKRKRKKRTKPAGFLVNGHVLEVRQARIICQTMYKGVSKPTGRAEAAERVGLLMRHASPRLLDAVAPQESFENALAPVKVKRAARRRRRRQRRRLDPCERCCRAGGPNSRGLVVEGAGSRADATFKERSIGEMLDPSWRVSSHLFRS